jgi:transcriptional regulator with XRE-family HTH domain
MNETIGNRISKFRKAKGMTQEELAFTMGVSSQAVSKWENDISCPDIGSLPKLAKTLGVTTDAILSGKQEDVMVLPPEQRKPNPWPLEDIMQRYSMTPEDILVVDDMQLACRMAEPLGVSVAYAGWCGMGVPEVEQEMKEQCAYSFISTDELEAFLFEED